MSVRTITPTELDELCRRGQPVELIDVRTPAEYRRSTPSSRGRYPSTPLTQGGHGGPQQPRDQPLYTICRSGSQARQACEKFLASGYANVVNVEGGTLAWEQAGLPVVRGKKAISLERQVRIAAGSLVLLGTALGAFAASGLPRPGRVRRGGPGLRRGHRHLRPGDAAGPDALEPGRRGGDGRGLSP